MQPPMNFRIMLWDICVQKITNVTTARLTGAGICAGLHRILMWFLRSETEELCFDGECARQARQVS